MRLLPPNPPVVVSSPPGIMDVMVGGEATADAPNCENGLNVSSPRVELDPRTALPPGVPAGRAGTGGNEA